MQDLWSVYHDEIPDFLLEFMETASMQRLKDVGMNCGCEYSQFAIFKNCQSYTRYDHSVGVALIVYHFTGDMKQSIAGLLHDIATPVFAHTIDFLNGDYIKQESTEAKTEMMIRSSTEIMILLKKYHLAVEDVCDYHIYPIADNDTPQLSADGLEYSLGNMLNYDFVDNDRIKMYYQHIYVNEAKNELVFDDLKIATAFTKDVIKTSKVYICDEDRYAMQSLAMLLKEAIDDHIINYDDLYTYEKYVINKLIRNKKYQEKWSTFCHYSIIERHDKQVENSFYIPAKKRYILPMYKDTRVDVLSDEIRFLLDDYLKISFEYYILGR